MLDSCRNRSPCHIRPAKPGLGNRITRGCTHASHSAALQAPSWSAHFPVPSHRRCHNHSFGAWRLLKRCQNRIHCVSMDGGESLWPNLFRQSSFRSLSCWGNARWTAVLKGHTRNPSHLHRNIHAIRRKTACCRIRILLSGTPGHLLRYIIFLAHYWR